MAVHRVGLCRWQWKELGLAQRPNVGLNGVHASASAFEAMAGATANQPLPAAARRCHSLLLMAGATANHLHRTHTSAARCHSPLLAAARCCRRASDSTGTAGVPAAPLWLRLSSVGLAAAPHCSLLPRWLRLSSVALAACCSAAECANWLGEASLGSHPFGAALLAAGIPEATLKDWSLDPVVALGVPRRRRTRFSMLSASNRLLLVYHPPAIDCWRIIY